MTAQSGLGFSGIVAIQIPDDGAPGTVLTKLTADNYDYDWLAGGGGGGQVNTVVGGVNITVDAADPINPIVNLDAAISGVSVNAVTLTAAGVATNFLDETGAYSVPPDTGGVVLTMFLSGLLMTILNLTQDAGASPISVDLAPILGLQRLQIAYDSAPAPPQIQITAVPEPLTIDAAVAGDVFAVTDVAGADLMRMSTTGSFIFGGSNASNTLSLQGSQAADRGQILINGSTDIDFDWLTDVGAYAITWAQTVPLSGGGVVGFVQLANNITINNGFFISSSVDDFSTLTWAVAPGFAVQTLFFARPTFQSTTLGVPPSQCFIYAAQAQYRLTGTGAVTVPTYRALSFAPIIRVDNAGDDLSITNVVGLTLQPLYNTLNATAVADFGTIRGVHMINAGTILFGQALGSEIAANWIGLDVEVLTGLVVSGVRAAVRSAIPAGASNFVIQNLGGAQSDFLDGAIHLNDDTALALGNTVAAPDAEVQWLPANNALDLSGGRIRVRGAMEYPPISPTNLGAGNTNDWTGLLTNAVNANMRHWARISGAGAGSTLTGIDTTVVEDGDSFELTNVSLNTISITHQDVASAAANRFITPTGVTYVLASGETVRIRYDTSTARWRLLGGTGA